MQRIPLIVSTLVVLAAVASCGAVEEFEHRAGAFLGGALSDFDGRDGSDPEARGVARDVATSRIYELIQNGSTISEGPITCTGLASSGYGSGAGSLTIADGLATVQFDLVSNNQVVTEVRMEGTFDQAEAQLAVDTPGASFVVSWTITWAADGQAFSLTAAQTLTGTDWVEF